MLLDDRLPRFCTMNQSASSSLEVLDTRLLGGLREARQRKAKLFQHACATKIQHSTMPHRIVPELVTFQPQVYREYSSPPRQAAKAKQNDSTCLFTNSETSSTTSSETKV